MLTEDTLDTVPRDQSEATRMLKIGEVSRITTLGKTVIYGLIKEGDFPKPRQLGARRVAWREDEVQAWMVSRAEANPEHLRK